MYLFLAEADWQMFICPVSVDHFNHILFDTSDSTHVSTRYLHIPKIYSSYFLKKGPLNFIFSEKDPLYVICIYIY